MQLQPKPTKVTHWAKSTESKVTTFLDDYLINYPVKSVRQSTRNLLNSLYKKGTPAQKLNLLNLIKERITKLSTIGNSSSEFLTLVYMIFQGEVQNKMVEKKHVLDMILQQGQDILKNVTANEKYDFYCYLSNTIEFSIELQPHLIEANGCLKCYGKTEFTFEQKDYKDILMQLKAHIFDIQLVFKKTYAVKDLKINLSKKKLIYKSVSIFYIDEKDQKKQLGGKYGPQQVLPSLQFNGKGLIFEFDTQKSKRHITCHVCGNANMPDQYSYICSMCFQKCVDIDGSFKVIGADPQILSDQLCSKYMSLECQKQELELLYDDIKSNRKAQFPNYSMIKQMQQTYGQIMKNLQLLNNSNSNNNTNKSYFKQCKYCFSCNIIEIENIVDYFKKVFDATQKSCDQLVQSFSKQNITLLIYKFFLFSQMNKLNHLDKKIVSILANLIILKNKNKINFQEELKLVHSPKMACEILYNIMRLMKIKQNKLKENETCDFDWNALSLYLNTNNFISKWTIKDKIKLFSTYFIKSQLIETIQKDTSEIQKQTFIDLDKVDIKQYNKFSNLLNFDINEILKLTATTHNKLFLLLLPQTLIPKYNFDIIDAEYLKYINVQEVPIINDQLIYSNIVYSPQPIIKLNLFSTLPNLVTSLSLDQSMKLITCLVKYKTLWNMNIKKAFKQFQLKLTQQSSQKKLLLSLQGYQISKQQMYLNQVYQILVPQRTKLIIRLEVPQAEMQKQQRSRDGGPVQYVYLPVREVKTEDLKGDTMRALHDWVTDQMKKMNRYMAFDLIVDKYIIDNLDLPIEVVYKKINQKEVKKKIGLQTYDFMRVIYRIQGIFGNSNESASGNPRDQKIQTCLSYSSYLLNRIPAINKNGLDVIMEILSKLKRSQSRSYRQKVFKILHIISMKPEIIKKIIECQYTDLIINFTSKFFSLQENELIFSEVMLDICSKIIKEANEEMINLRKKSFNDGFGLRKESEMMDIQNTQQGSSQSEKAVKYLLEKVKQCDDKDRKDLAEKIITIVPFLSKDQYGTSKYLYDYFELGQTKVADLRSNEKINWFLQFIDNLAESYTTFKIVCRQNKLTDQLVANIVQYIQHFKTLEEKKNIKNLDILQLSLSMIKGLIRGDEVLQKSLYDKKIIQQLERVSKLSEKQMQAKNIKVGKVLTLSYQIINYFKSGHIVHPEISDFIKGQHAQKMRRNQQKKRARLQAIKKKNVMIAQKFENEIMVNQQQDILICPICREGYNKKSDVLGVYIYSSKTEVNAVQGWWKENKRQPGLTSVSYFTPIHFECHMNAYATDQKNQKSQWQGALVRNSQVKCNGWIAIKGPKTTDDEYDKVNKKYFDKNNKITGFWIVMNDLNGLLQKFSTEYNFSQQTKGSSSTHNCKLILVLISTICHYMKKAGQELKLLDQGIKYIEEHMTKRGHLLNLFFCVSMFTNTYSHYQDKKQKYLRLIEHLELTDFKEKKKFYIYLALINEINCLIHVTLKEEKRLFEYMDKFIPQNFGNLISAFEKIAEKYKNVFRKWENQEQAKAYFAVSSS